MPPLTISKLLENYDDNDTDDDDAPIIKGKTGVITSNPAWNNLSSLIQCVAPVSLAPSYIPLPLDSRSTLPDCIVKNRESKRRSNTSACLNEHNFDNKNGSDSDNQPILLRTRDRARKRKAMSYTVKNLPVSKKKDIHQVKNENSKEENKENQRSIRFKEGQRFMCAPMGDATRAFYESLLKERPNSVLANKYCIEHGILIGTQLKEQLARYYDLKEAGAFKGAAGGIKPLTSSILLCDSLMPLRSTAEVTSTTKSKSLSSIRKNMVKVSHKK